MVGRFLGDIAGGISMNLVLLFTFRLLGFGWNGDGILLKSSSQSEKLIAVWTEIEPIPLIVNNPVPIIIGVIHAYLFSWLSTSWPKGIANRSLRFAGIVFILTFLFWEFFTPSNMFGEPLHLISLELVFWALIAVADGLAISAILGRNILPAAVETPHSSNKAGILKG